jgi:hypothetical protein
VVLPKRFERSHRGRALTELRAAADAVVHVPGDNKHAAPLGPRPDGVLLGLGAELLENVEFRRRLARQVAMRWDWTVLGGEGAGTVE